MAVELIFATKNPHKIEEARQVLGDRVHLLPLPAEAPEAPEPHDTLYENALAKAAFYSDWLGGQTVIAEDSGLFVPALGGQPGVRTAHFGGPLRLLESMQRISDRRAYFVAVIVLYKAVGTYYIASAAWHGAIATELRGKEGFGYDPVFIPQGMAQTVAELGEAWKTQYSHRTRALRLLLRKCPL